MNEFTKQIDYTTIYLPPRVVLLEFESCFESKSCFFIPVLATFVSVDQHVMTARISEEPFCGSTKKTFHFMIFQIFEQLCVCAEDFVKAVDMEANTGKSFNLKE